MKLILAIMFFNNKKRKGIFKIFFILIILIVVFISIKFFNVSRIYKSAEMGGLINELRTFKGALLFIALYSIRPVFVVLPASPMAIAGGAIYGTLVGTIIVVIGALLSGTFGFFMARFIGKEYFDKITHQKISKILSNSKNSKGLEKSKIFQSKTKIEEGSWATVIFLNFIGLPWDIVSIASGLSKIKYKDFLLGISISSVPQSFIAVYFGNVLFSIRSFSDIFQLKTFIVLILVILGISLPHIIKRRIEK